jgi:hypothetical protein
MVLLAAVVAASAVTAAPLAARAQDPPPVTAPSPPAPPGTSPGSTVPGTGGGGVVPADPDLDQPAPDVVVPPEGALPPGADPGLPELPELPAEPVGPVVDPSPRIRVLLASFVVQGAEEVVAAEEAALATVQAAHDAAAGAEAVATEQLAEARRHHDAERARLQGLAVASFVRGSGAVPVAGVDLGYYDRRRGDQLTSSVVEGQVVRLRAAVGAVAGAEAEVAVQRQAVAAAAEVVAAHQARVDEVAGALAEARAELGRARGADVEVLFEPGVEAAWSLTIMGDSTFTADELAAYAEERAGGRSRASVGAGELARFFVEEGAAEGMRGDMAFAQAVLETGWFTNDDTVRFNNYAGIGHCDTCPTGFAFPGPREGVRAQFQLLKSYVERQPTYAHPLVDRRLRGPAACCQTWAALTGVWATSPTYGPVILGIYLEMLEWLAERRGAAG